MAKKRAATDGRATVREPDVVYGAGKVPKSYRLSEATISAAQTILGVPTATAAIEVALDMVVFREELLRGTRAMRGTVILPYDDES
ncbi:MAG: hypothetical protein V4550_19265 [Gemmatimonadota bacterium]